MSHLLQYLKTPTVRPVSLVIKRLSLFSDFAETVGAATMLNRQKLVEGFGLIRVFLHSMLE